MLACRRGGGWVSGILWWYVLQLCACDKMRHWFSVLWLSVYIIYYLCDTYLCIRYLTLYGGTIPLLYVCVHKMGHIHRIPHTRCLAYQTLYPIYVQYFLLGRYTVFMLRKIIMQDLIDTRKFAFWACSEWRPLPKIMRKLKLWLFSLACVLLAQNYCTICMFLRRIVLASHKTGVNVEQYHQTFPQIEACRLVTCVLVVLVWESQVCTNGFTPT